jgi:hypothetical protein
MRPGDRPVALVDGRQVSNYSEAWRAECEARHVLAMANVHLRRIYLADVRKRRGDVAGKQLEDLVRAVWAKGREST